MKGFLTIQIESYLGAIFISLLAAFFVGLIFISVKNFSSEVTVIASEQVKVKTVSSTERVLMKSWIEENKIELPADASYRYILEKYPSKPWLK